MNQIIDSCLTVLNSIGRVFCDYAADMFVQSSVLIVMLLIIDFLLRKRVRATFRYCVWMLVFVKLVLPPTLCLPTGIGYWCGDYLSADSPVLQQVSNIVQFESAETHTPQDLALPIETSDLQPSRTFPEAVAPAASVVTSIEPITWRAVLFLVWLAGVLVVSTLLIQRIRFVRWLIAQSSSAKGQILDVLNQCRCKVGIRHNVELRLSNNTSSPAVCGLFNPIILMPASLIEELPSDKLKAVFIHELAHIKRGDLWVNFAQTLLQVIYLYNPFVWLANAVVRRIREQAVDEMVLVALGPEAKSYSNTLIDIAEMAFWRTSFSLRLIGVVESKRALKRRIRHMLTRPMPKSARLGIVGLVTVIVTALILLPMAKAKKNQRLFKGIDEKLKVTDKAGELTINSLYMPSPNGKSLVGTNKVTMCVDVTNNSEKDLYLGLEYYTDSGYIAKVFSPGASSLAQIKKVPANWQGKLEYPIRYSRFAKGGYVRITLARCTSKQNTKEKILPFLPPEVEIIYEKKYNIVPIDDTQPDARASTDSSFTAALPNGVTVELVGLTHHVLTPYENAEPLTWWRANGEESTTSPYWRLGRSWLVSSDEICYDVLLNVQGAEHYGLRGETALARAHIPRQNPLRVDGERLESFDKRVIICNFKKNQDKGTIRVGIASGPWQEIESWKYRWVSGEPHNVAVKSESALVLEWPRQQGNSVVVDITHKYTDKDRQLLVIDKDGKTHRAQSRTGVGSGVGLIRDIYRFDNLDRKNMGTLKFQMRPYHWAHFKNVSLKAGLKTDVKVAYRTIVTRRIRQAGKPESGRDETYEFLTEPSRKTRLLTPKESVNINNWISIVASVVKDSGRYLLPEDEELTLSELIRAAGYDPQKVPASFLEIMRPVKLGRLRAYSIFSRNLETLFGKKESDPVLKQHDGIVGGWIDPSPNRKEFLAPYSFGDVVELTINDDSSEGDMFIDLDTAELFTPANDLDKRDLENVFKWMSENGIDAVCDTSSKVRGLIGFGMVALSVDNYFWNTEIPEFWDRLIMRIDMPVLISAEHVLPATYLIKTSEYKMGVLQILGFTDKPAGVRIRYKLVDKREIEKTDVQVEVEKR